MSRVKLFVYGFLGTLVLVLPVYLIYAAVGLSRTKTVDVTQTDVPVFQATAADAKNILLSTGESADNPTRFYLLRLDAYRNIVSVSAFMADSEVYAGQTRMTLQHAAAQAGPAEAAAALASALQIDIPYYAYVPRDILIQTATDLGYARINMSAYVSNANLAKMQLNIAGTSTAVMTPLQVADALDSTLIPAHNKAQVASLAAGSLLQNEAERLPSVLNTLLRDNSAALFTNITAADIIDLERIAKLLIKYQPTYWAEAMPAQLTDGQVSYDTESLALAAEHFSAALLPLPAADNAGNSGGVNSSGEVKSTSSVTDANSANTSGSTAGSTGESTSKNVSGAQGESKA